MSDQKVLIFGNGFVASLLRDSAHLGFDVTVSTVDVLDQTAVAREFRTYVPDIVINTAAKTNIDWCEQHRDLTFNVNVLGADALARQCVQARAYFVQFSSGCLQESRGPDDVKREQDAINPRCFYAWTKAWAEHLISDRCERDGLEALFVRPRLLLSSRLSSRNSILKLFTYTRFIDVAQSATVAEDMVDAVWRLIEARAVGACNVANPGLISPWEIAGMLRDLVDPEFRPTRIDTDELNALTQVRRIRTVLSTERLSAHGIKLPHIKAGVRGVLTAIAGQLETEEGRRILALTERDTKKKLKKQVPAQRRATRDAQPDAT
ncbi:MAG TPA: sugar nucleotide-binding protein [Polyangiaceae bacterium]|nr:sugar nucleotide-binding protein [Polyangiaceae bacterium]